MAFLIKICYNALEFTWQKGTGMITGEKTPSETKIADSPLHSAWTEDGYIQNQDLLTGYIYRTIPAKENCCGPVAVYNLCRHSGQNLEFEALLREMDGMHRLHMPGPTFMYVMRKCLTEHLPGWHEVHGRDEAVRQACQSSMGIFRYHEGRIPHFVGYYRERENTFHFYNVCDGRENVVMSMEEFTSDHLLGGSVKLIWWE